MKYVLVDNFDNVADKKDLSDKIGISGARTYFKGIKQIDNKGFNKLWKVMTELDYNSEKLQSYPGYIKWWKEEKEITDEELKI